jgi:ATP-binding cassette subfamily B protein
VVVIAHRLSTVQGADRIVVLEAGRIIEEGSHAVLMGQGGRYRDLCQRQLIEMEH